MENVYLIQLVGTILAVAGLIALTAAAHVFGARLSPAEKRRASDEWNRNRKAYRLPVNLDAIAASILFLGGIGILIWAKFNLCSFLAFWFPPLPETIKLLLSCD